MKLWKIITKKFIKKEVDSMWKGYFRNLETGKIFTKMFDNDYEKRKFLTKCRYSKKIKSLGCVKVDQLIWE